MIKVVQFFMILVMYALGLNLQAMEQAKENDTAVCRKCDALPGLLEKSDWDALSTEIRLHIFSFLPSKVEKIKDFFDYALVNRDFASLINTCHFSQIKNFEFAGKKKITITDVFVKAAREGHYEVVSILIERGIDVNDTDNEGYTALLAAAEPGQTETVRLLINCGANSAARTYWDSTSLVLAATNGHIEIVNLLIQHSTTIDLQDYKTALKRAHNNGHTEIVEMLKIDCLKNKRIPERAKLNALSFYLKEFKRL